MVMGMVCVSIKRGFIDDNDGIAMVSYKDNDMVLKFLMMVNKLVESVIRLQLK